MMKMARKYSLESFHGAGSESILCKKRRVGFGVKLRERMEFPGVDFVVVFLKPLNCTFQCHVSKCNLVLLNGRILFRILVLFYPV